jgi:hypothetical protein
VTPAYPSRRATQQPNLLAELLQRWTPLSVIPANTSGLSLEQGLSAASSPRLRSVVATRQSPGVARRDLSSGIK